MLALGQSLRSPRLDLGERQAFPGAKRYLDQPIVEAIALRIEIERGADELHGFARAMEWARHVGAISRLTSIDRQQIAQHRAAMGRLAAPACVERRVAMALQALLDVPIGLAVADVVEHRHDRLAPSGRR